MTTAPRNHALTPAIKTNVIRLWEHARGDGVTDDTEAVRKVIAMAMRMGGATILCGGKERVYLIGGETATYGTFNGVGGPFAFKRGVIRLYSNLHFSGEGAKFLLSGGRREPGGLFYHPFWEDKAAAQNVSFVGIDIDGNIQNQHITPSRAGIVDGDQWQHGHGVLCLRARNWYFERCTVHGFRGAGINLDGVGIKILHCTFYDNFSHDIGGGQNDAEIAYNTFKDGVADSRWVAALDIEKLEAHVPIINVRIHHNVFDFRQGYAPPERTPKFASDSKEALAARTHYRRAVTFSFFYEGFPNNIYNGTMHTIAFTDNTVYQGCIDAFNWCDVDISRNTIINTYENLEGAALANPNAITVSQAANNKSKTPWVVGLRGATIRDNRISHDIDGFAILVDRYEDIDVGGGAIKNARSAGIRINACAGLISDLTITNTGRAEIDLPPDRAGELSSAVVVFGDLGDGLTIRKVNAVDTRDGARRRLRHIVYANVSGTPPTRIEDCRGTNLLGAPVRDVNRTTRQSAIVANAAVASASESWWERIRAVLCPKARASLRG